MRRSLCYARFCLVESRPAVEIIFVGRFLTGAVLCASAPVPWLKVLGGAAGWCCATVAIYVYNGIADRAEDIVNESTRPIAAGDLPVRVAAWVAVLSTTVACLAAAFEGAYLFVATAGYLLIGYAYSGPPLPLKNRFYTASVAGGLLGLITYLGGALATRHALSVDFAVFAVAMSLWMGGVGGIAKDLSDIAGDRAALRRTWPVALGERRARLALCAASGLVVGLFAVACGLLSVRLEWCAAALFVGAVAVVTTSARMPDGASRPRRRRPYHAFMVTQYLSHVVLVGTVGFVMRL